jgi:nucleotide-binding universal stress UspA family protein
MARSLGYRRILVPFCENVDSEKAMDVACRLAAARGATITVVTVVEIPALLPLDAHMREEEMRSHRLLERAAAIADSYGVGVAPRLVRAREAARAIVEAAAKTHSEIIVVGAPRRARAKAGAAALGTTVEHVLKKATCRVMVIGDAPLASSAARAAAA